VFVRCCSRCHMSCGALRHKVQLMPRSVHANENCNLGKVWKTHLSGGLELHGDMVGDLIGHVAEDPFVTGEFSWSFKPVRTEWSHHETGSVDPVPACVVLDRRAFRWMKRGCGAAFRQSRIADSLYWLPSRDSGLLAMIHWRTLPVSSRSRSGVFHVSDR